MGLKSALAISASATLTSALDLATASAPTSFTRSVALGSGTGAGKADRLFSDRRTINANTSEDLDLAGSLLDALGGSASMVRVKGLIVSASASNLNNVVIGAGTAPWVTLLNSTGTLTLRPGATVAVFAGAADATGYAVTATTGDVLKVANSGAGTSVTYDIVIIGSSA